MSDWKESAIKKKMYRRGGVEPDPPRTRHKKRKKCFRIEYCVDGSGTLDRIFRQLFKNDKREWYGYGKYCSTADAMRAVSAQVQ